MSVMEGVIDHLGRPTLRIQTAPPGSDSFLCLIDTGFNRYLFLERAAALRLGFLPHSKIIDQIVLGDGSVKMAQVVRGSILWFGSPLVVDAHIVPGAQHRSRYSSPEHQIDGMIGTALLEGLHVFFDFQFRRVTIQRPVSSGG